MSDAPSAPPVSWSAALAGDGRLPSRYATSFEYNFRSRVLAALGPSATILDFGSGRDPAFTRAELPRDSTYIGLDISPDELAAAPAGAYDQTVVADISERNPELVGRFDVVVSWQVLEHVRSIERAFSNLREYLKPDGVLVSMLSGRFAAFAVANRLLPDRVGQFLAHRALQIDSEEVFPATYDMCYYDALTSILKHWRCVDVTPFYRGAVYFRQFRPLLAAYIRYENWLERHARRNLATHYLLEAHR
jgi:SAM-dependent methyltransferase